MNTQLALHILRCKQHTSEENIKDLFHVFNIAGTPLGKLLLLDSIQVTLMMYK
jgi:hypothetical protein